MYRGERERERNPEVNEILYVLQTLQSLLYNSVLFNLSTYIPQECLDNNILSTWLDVSVN